MYFIVSNHFTIVEIKIDLKKPENVIEPKMFKRNAMDIFQKIWNTNGLNIQRQILKK
jgi:hypothetical protein